MTMPGAIVTVSVNSTPGMSCEYGKYGTKKENVPENLPEPYTIDCWVVGELVYAGPLIGRGHTYLLHYRKSAHWC